MIVENLRREFSRTPGVLNELLSLARIACDNGQDQLASICDLQMLAEILRRLALAVPLLSAAHC